MKFLAWDTSSKTGVLAAFESSSHDELSLISEWTLNVDTTHSERLLWAIDEVLQASRWSLQEVDVFGVGVGPGSFTGLRIGVTTARTLASTVKKPLIGVSSLAVLARPAANWLSLQAQNAMIVATTDACKGELFALWGEAGVWKKGVNEKVLTPSELMAELMKILKPKIKSKPWLALGEGRQRYLEEWKKLPHKQELKLEDPFIHKIQPRSLATLVWETYQAGLASDPLSVYPKYLRASDAELRRKKTCS